MGVERNTTRLFRLHLTSSSQESTLQMIHGIKLNHIPVQTRASQMDNNLPKPSPLLPKAFIGCGVLKRKRFEFDGQGRRRTVVLKYLYSDHFWHLLMTRNFASTVELSTSRRFSIHQELSQEKFFQSRQKSASIQQRVSSLLSASTSPSTSPRSATPQLNAFHLRLLSSLSVLSDQRLKIAHQVSY